MLENAKRQPLSAKRQAAALSDSRLASGAAEENVCLIARSLAMSGGHLGGRLAHLLSVTAFHTA